MPVERTGELVPIRTDNEKLAPLNRRTLTTQAQDNPTRYEFGSLVPFSPDETTQILGWTQNASIAIAQVGQTLLTLPGETRVTAAEKRDRKVETRGTRDSTTHHDETVRGFSFIAFYAHSQSSTDYDESSRSEETSHEERARQEVSSTRPGQFLSGTQIEDALSRVAIARREGLLFLPAAHSELDRQQKTLLYTTHRAVEDHQRANASWAEDIQEGAISGLITQLVQASDLLKKGYSSNEVNNALSEDANQTLRAELLEVSVNTFRDLLEFATQDTSRRNNLERAGVVLRDTVIFHLSTDPNQSVEYLRTWLEIFSRNATGEAALIIGKSFAQTLSQSLFFCQKEGYEEVFEDLATLAREVGEGGTLLILNSVLDSANEQQIDVRTLELCRSLIEQLPTKGRDNRFITTVMRFTLVQPERQKVESMVETLLADFEILDGNQKFYIDRGEKKVWLRTLVALTNFLSADEWKQLAAIIKQEGTPWVVRKAHGSFLPAPLQGLKDPDLIRAFQDFYAQEISNLINSEPEFFEYDEYEEQTLRHMFNQLDPSTREELWIQLHERAQEARDQALNYFDSHGAAILLLVYSQELVGRATNSKHTSVPAQIILSNLEFAQSDEGRSSEHYSFVIRSLQYLQKAANKLNEYSHTYNWYKVDDLKSSWLPWKRDAYRKLTGAREELFTKEYTQITKTISRVMKLIGALNKPEQSK